MLDRPPEVSVNLGRCRVMRAYVTRVSEETVRARVLVQCGDDLGAARTRAAANANRDRGNDQICACNSLA
jgi:hypothetical protein